MGKTSQEHKNKFQQSVGQTSQKALNQRRQELSERPASKAGLLAGLLLVVCTAVLATHWPALSAKATFLDDGQYITENPLVQNPGLTSAKRFLTEVLEPSTVQGSYIPLTMLSVMADYALGGRYDNLRPFHRTSLALHVANSALVITLLYLLFGKVWVAAAAGLLFGIHPLTVERITWVADRKTILAAFFALWCLILYVRYTHKRNWKLYAGTLIMYVLALMSKPTSLPLPFLLLLLDYWVLKPLNRRAILEKLPFFITGGVWMIISFVSFHRTSQMIMPYEYSPVRIPLTLCHNIVFYLHKIVWPANLSPHYPFPEPFSLANPTVLAGLVGTCVLIPALLVSWRWTRDLLMGWLFFFVAVFPTLGIIGFTPVIAANRFAYFPMLGILLALASFFRRLCATNSISKQLTRSILIAMAVLALAGTEAVATRKYITYWRDTVSLCEHILTLTPDEAPVHYELGYALQLQGRLDKAISHYDKTLQLNPSHVKAHNNLGTVLLAWGKLGEAINHFRQAILLKPDFADAHNNLAWVLATHPDPKLRNATQAIALAERAAELTNYQNAPILDTLAAAYAAGGQFNRAVTTVQTAIELASALQANKLVSQFYDRLKLYSQAKPYQEPLERQYSPHP